MVFPNSPSKLILNVDSSWRCSPRYQGGKTISEGWQDCCSLLWSYNKTLWPKVTLEGKDFFPLILAELTSDFFPRLKLQIWGETLSFSSIKKIVPRFPYPQEDLTIPCTGRIMMKLVPWTSREILARNSKSTQALSSAAGGHLVNPERMAQESTIVSPKFEEIWVS